MRGICRGLAGLSLLLPLMAAPAWAQVCGTNGTLNNLEIAIITAGQPQQLLCARENTPQNTRVIGNITGLMGGERIVGVDFRPNDRAFIALTSAANLVTINPQTGAATQLAALQTNGTRVTLTGTQFAVDFNPTSNALRIVGDTGVNLRVAPPVDAGNTIVDGPATAIGGNAPLPGVTAAGYINNDQDATTGTILYVVDTTQDQLTIVSPPNAGTVAPVGALGMNIGPNVSFDIFARAATANQPASPARGLLVYQLNGQQQFTLGTVDLTTGRISNPRAFAANATVAAVAIPYVQGNVQGN